MFAIVGMGLINVETKTKIVLSIYDICSSLWKLLMKLGLYRVTTGPLSYMKRNTGYIKPSNKCSHSGSSNMPKCLEQSLYFQHSIKIHIFIDGYVI